MKTREPKLFNESARCEIMRVVLADAYFWDLLNLSIERADRGLNRIYFVLFKIYLAALPAYPCGDSV